MTLVRVGETRAPPVLVVDDDDDSRALYVMTLRRCGFAVEEAENGATALEKAFALAPDVILLDHLMPVMDGREAAKRLRGDARTRGTPIVMLTGFARTTAMGRALRASGDCDAYLLKPCDLDDLIAALHGALSRATAAAAQLAATAVGRFAAR